MKTYNTEEEILKDFENGKISKYEKYIQLGKLGKNAEYFTEDELMCMYCDDLYTCDNMNLFEEKLLECKQEKENWRKD